MKQKCLLGLALASILVLSGCTATTAKENGKYVIASIDGKNIFADDIYEELSASTAGKNTLFTYLLDELITTNFPVTSDMKDNASNIVSNIEASYKNQYSDNDEAQKQLESALSSTGYENMDAYKESLIQSLQYSEFIKKYVKANFDEVFEDYYKKEAPRYISLIKVAMSDPENPTEGETEKLNEIKSLLKTDKGFAEIAASYSDDDSKSAKGNLGIIDSTSGLKNTYGENVEKIALSLEKGKVSDAIKGNDGYYFLYCTSTDKDTIKKDLETIDIDSPLLVYDSYIVYLAFNTYELKYSDEKIEKNVKEIVDEALKARAEEREG